jgi:hypothetical protein
VPSATAAGKGGTLSAYETRKEGPNLGRLFAKCRHCGAFRWLRSDFTTVEIADLVFRRQGEIHLDFSTNSAHLFTGLDGCEITS